MIGNKKVVCVIPARLKSTRFPKKVLALLRGKPLVQWVYEAAKRVALFDEVVIAVDHEETERVVNGFQAPYFMTPETCESGTDRLVELYVSKKIQGDIFVGWQADEPFITESMIKTLLATADQDEGVIWTLKKKCALDQIKDPNVCKVVSDKEGFALYFSRAPIPYCRDERDFSAHSYYKHIGIYAFSKGALDKLTGLKVCELERLEKLEQLRFLYNQIPVRVHETREEVLGIDLPEHLEKAEKLLAGLPSK